MTLHCIQFKMQNKDSTHMHTHNTNVSVTDFKLLFFVALVFYITIHVHQAFEQVIRVYHVRCGVRFNILICQRVGG